MKLVNRVARHWRIMRRNYTVRSGPPFLVLFINSVCNMRCEHCFYWRNLNRRDDLTKGELFALSRSLGRIENLSISGGEPFLRDELSAICRQFVRHNQVRQIYVPSNGYFTDRTEKQVAASLEEPELELFVVELSLDGMPSFHDELRGTQGSFEQAMQTYDALAVLQEADPRLRIHAASTATHANLDQIRQLSGFLYQRCPRIDHHNLAIIRGDRRNPSLLTPDPQAYRDLYAHIQRLWGSRETGRYGAIVEPLTQWAKLESLEKQRQIVPCRAGTLTGVVYANGDVSVCELHEPLGNLRDKSFPDIWSSKSAQQLREYIAQRRCHCTTEVFLWPSIVYQPVQLVRTMLGARIWRRPAAVSSCGNTEGAPGPWCHPRT